MRKVCLHHVHLLARKDPRVFFIGSDLGVGTLDGFRQEFPDRFLMEGISEANVVGMAAGLALEGKIVYVNSISTFLTRRAFEQVCLDLCLHNLPVRLIGNGGGMVYAPLGPTHMATDDIALMRVLPNMAVLAPADAREMANLMPLTLDWPGPIYIRLAKGGDPVVSDPYAPAAIGQAVAVGDGRDALIITTGVMLKVGLDAVTLLAARGVKARVVHVPTVKPLDKATLLEHAAAVRAIVAIEEHSIIGGLGSAIAELVSEAGFRTAKPFRRLGVPDIFPDDYGSQPHLFSRYGLTAEAVADTVDGLLA
jgi:transketolase